MPDPTGPGSYASFGYCVSLTPSGIFDILDALSAAISIAKWHWEPGMPCLQGAICGGSGKQLLGSKIRSACLLLLIVSQGPALAEPDRLAPFNAGEAHQAQV